MKITVIMTTVRCQRQGPPTLHQVAHGLYGSWQEASAEATRLCMKGIVAHPVELVDLPPEPEGG